MVAEETDDCTSCARFSALHCTRYMTVREQETKMHLRPRRFPNFSRFVDTRQEHGVSKDQPIIPDICCVSLSTTRWDSRPLSKELLGRDILSTY